MADLQYNACVAIRPEVNITEYIDTRVELNSTLVSTLHPYLLTLTSGRKRYIVNQRKYSSFKCTCTCIYTPRAPPRRPKALRFAIHNQQLYKQFTNTNMQKLLQLIEPNHKVKSCDRN